MTTLFGSSLCVDSDARLAGTKAAEQALQQLDNQPPQLVIVFATSKLPSMEVLKAVRAVSGDVPLIGCTTAGEFTADATQQGSVAVGMLASDNMRCFVTSSTNLKKDPFASVQRAVEELPKEVEGFPNLSAIMLHDGLAGVGEEAVLSGSAAFGKDIKFFGGSAGDDLRFHQTQVFVNDQVLEDAVVIALLASKQPICTGVQHGHQPIGPSLRITRASENVVYEVDGQPAWEVWKTHTKSYAKGVGIDVDALSDPTDVGQFLIRFELGLRTDQEEYKVRVPLSKNDDGSLNFACTVSEGSVFRIMQSPKEAQIESARAAAQLAKEQLKGRSISGVLVFDCCCRGIILGESFHRGVEAINQVVGGVPLLGFQTYGEICMDPGQFSGYHNTTTVVALLPA